MRHLEYTGRGILKHQPKGYCFHTDVYDLFQVIYVSTGRLVFEGETQNMTLSPGYVAILRNGSRFTLSCPDVEYTGVGFHALGELPAQFYGKSEVLRSNPEIQTLARLIQQQFSNPGVEFNLQIEGLGRALGWEAINLSESMNKMLSAIRSPHEWAQAARNALDANVYNVTSAREALSPLPLSYRQISRYFSAMFGVSPKHYQLNSKILASQTLLRETNLSVTMIAMELGFSSSQHFATQFKAITGKSPHSFRKTCDE